MRLTITAIGPQPLLTPPQIHSPGLSCAGAVSAGLDWRAPQNGTASACPQISSVHKKTEVSRGRIGIPESSVGTILAGQGVRVMWLVLVLVRDAKVPALRRARCVCGWVFNEPVAQPTHMRLALHAGSTIDLQTQDGRPIAMAIGEEVRVVLTRNSRRAICSKPQCAHGQADLKRRLRSLDAERSRCASRA
ncbi:hypothetical protein XHV734_1492 [Xanthomonas hortorum pv. vitians]|nr:hypothetical protein XHV734_1492 [Xanthomonas hortorum pv. vitians]